MYFRDGIGTPTGNLELTSGESARWPERRAAGGESTGGHTRLFRTHSPVHAHAEAEVEARFVNDPDTPQVELGSFLQDTARLRSPPPKTSTARKRPLKAQESVPHGELFFDLYAPAPPPDLDLPQADATCEQPQEFGRE